MCQFSQNYENPNGVDLDYYLWLNLLQDGMLF